ncbi:carbohydrate ABC transporter substrate-binding protein (CUT1 family) [Motilibacter rhizosphaerae]|uniref:Carbohydrate ABC transporter substrate-binding protein (CUT1 family) n=1 Tax=Motilibacter rhizosphaerae TaxID=598652 RepID=A0A4Q7NWP0_9ACTN|nr:extracellular solute-binding protein [Motilibacter rhizosphaerae]RZS91430.1 carbohydrate ABC transporter substrate-binding protein (CUT1 family) [Motilibacter rhizosphaerae]
MSKQRRLSPRGAAGRALVGVVALGALATGCSSGASSTSTTAAGGSAAPAASSAGAASTGSGGAPGAVHIKVWAWYPEFKSVVDAFNASHKDIQVDWTNVGTGPDQYAKLKTAFKAGSGAPDVAMVEFQELPSFEILGKLTDMGKYGANDDKSLYADWAWTQATDGDKVYAIPVDGGPMALMYRKDLFDKYQIPVPKTWDEYAADAAKIHAADSKAYIASFGKDGGWINGLMWQAGCKPYTYSFNTAKDTVGVNLTAPACKKVFDYYGDLEKKGLFGKDPFFTADMNAALDSGKYWTWASAGWTPGYLAGSLKKTAGKWAVAPMPQWTAGGTANSDWGGSTFTVTTQTKHPKEATIVARELFGKSQAAWDIGVNKAFLYPLVKQVADSPAFTDKAYDFFGGQKVNQIYVPASNGIGDFQYSPFQDFVFSTLNDNSAAALAGKKDWSSVLDDTQKTISDYAKQQGFKVTQ